MPVRMLGMGDGCRLDGQLRLDPHEMKPWSLSGKCDLWMSLKRMV